MFIQVQAGDEQVATYDFLLSALEEAVMEMKLAKPIALDRFLIRNSAFPTHVIPEVSDGDTLKLKFSFNEDETSKYNPKLIKCTGINMTKSIEDVEWNKYFSMIGGPEPLPGDSLTVYPNENNECAVKVNSSLDPSLPTIYIAYGASLSLKMKESRGEEGKSITFRMDPLVKVSSNQGG